MAWYEGSGTSDRRWFASDQLGSVIAITDASGARIGAANSYDAYGQRGATNAGRFQYTGQAWLAEVELYHFNARAYSATLGRFLQSDPILHAGGMNLYAYVGNDPVNRIDPLGLSQDQIVVMGDRIGFYLAQPGPQVAIAISRLGRFARGAAEGREQDPGSDDEIVVVGVRPPPTQPGSPPRLILIQDNGEDPCVRGPRGRLCGDALNEATLSDLMNLDPCSGTRSSLNSLRAWQRELNWYTWGLGGLAAALPLVGAPPALLSGGAALSQQDDIDRLEDQYRSCLSRNGVDW